MQRSWDLYGEENFEFKIIQKCKESELNDKEIFYISKYKALDNLQGYNQSEGGGGSTGYKHTEEAKRKISKIQTGKKLTKEHRKKLSEAKKGVTPKNIDILLQSNINNMLPIMQFNKEGEFVREWDGINECARGMGLPATNIVKTLKGKHNNCGGYVFYYKDEYENKKINKTAIVDRFKRDTSNSKKMIPVVQLSLEGEHLATFKSLKDASVHVSGNATGVMRCCKGVSKTYYGYKWMYERDFTLK